MKQIFLRQSLQSNTLPTKKSTVSSVRGSQLQPPSCQSGLPTGLHLNGGVPICLNDEIVPLTADRSPTTAIAKPRSRSSPFSQWNLTTRAASGAAGSDDPLYAVEEDFDPVATSPPILRSRGFRQSRGKPLGWKRFVGPSFIGEKRRAALESHVPESVRYLLFTDSEGGLGFIAYGTGLTGRRQSTSTVLFALPIAFVLMTIIDLDRPREGLIRISQQSLLARKSSLQGHEWRLRMSHEQMQRSAWPTRVLIGFALAPIAAALLFALPHLVAGDGLGLKYLTFSATVGYPTMLIVGVPVYFLMRRRGLNDLLLYVLVGGLLGIVAYLGAAQTGLLTRSLGVLAMMMHLPVAVFLGAVAAATFWLIVRPDRYR